MMEDSKKKTMEKLIRKFLDQADEKEQDQLFVKLNKMSPDPEWSHYIFHSEEFYDDEENLDISRVVEKIFSYKPICL